MAKHLLTIQDLTAQQIAELVKEATYLKKNPLTNRSLTDKALGLLFQKPSVRTRVSFQVGMAQLGGQAIYMSSADLGGANREAPKDLALVLSRYLDGIVVRTFGQAEVREMAQSSPIPIINGLSDSDHPCQALSDLLTIQEQLKTLQGVRLAFIGDGNNVCHSLMEAAALVGMDFRAATPKSHAPDPEVVDWAKAESKKSGGQVVVTTDPVQAVQNAQIIYADVWTSMGQEEERDQRLKTFKPYQVNNALMAQADLKAKFMHCLPAHRGEEVSDELLDSPSSIVYDQAENRMHMQKAILLSLMA